MQQIQGKTWNKELHREMDSITHGAAPFKTIHVHYIHQSTRTSDMMQRTSTMATVSYRCQAIDKQNCSFYSLHCPSPGFPCLLSSAFDSPSFSMHANISMHKLIYLATEALSDSFWIYRRYINKSIYLSIYLCMWCPQLTQMHFWCSEWVSPFSMALFFFFRADSTDSLDCLPILLGLSIFTL